MSPTRSATRRGLKAKAPVTRGKEALPARDSAKAGSKENSSVKQKPVIRVPRLAKPSRFRGSDFHAKEVRDSLQERLSTPSSAWQHYYLLIHGVLKRDKAMGLKLLSSRERKFYQEKLENLYGNHGFAWSNVHRSMNLWYAYGSCVVFLLPPEVRRSERDFKSPAVVKTLEKRLQALIDRCMFGLNARKGSCLRCHPAIYDPDDKKVPFHYHAWILPYWFRRSEAGMLKRDFGAFRYDPEAALRKCMAEGRELLRKESKEGSPVTRWLRTRRFTDAQWTELLEKLEAGWRNIVKGVFLLKRLTRGIPLVRTQRREGKFGLRVIPEYRSSFIRDAVDLARISCYMVNGPSIRERVKIGVFPETGRVKALFGHEKIPAEYDAVDFLRRFIPPKPAVREVGFSGVFHGNSRDDNSVMRVFEAVLSENLVKHNALLYWATMSPADVRARMKPDSARRLFAKAGKVLAVMEDKKARWKKGSEQETVWKKYNRFFSGEYTIILRYLMYLAEEAAQKVWDTTAKKKPHQLLRRHPLSEMKAEAENDARFRQSRYWIRKMPPKP